jgi:hypothetical protein
MEHTVDAASWRRWTQFSLRGLMLLVLMVALFFSGRATLQQEVNASRATFARQRELHAQMMDFRNRLKPLKLPPGVRNMDRKTKPGEITAWETAGYVGGNGNGYCYNRFYGLNIAQLGANNGSDYAEDPVGAVVRDLARQIREQFPGEVHWQNIPIRNSDSNSAVAVLQLPYGVTILVGAYAGNIRRGENLRDVMQLEIIHAHRVDLNP